METSCQKSCQSPARRPVSALARIGVFLIKCYQYLLSPLLGPSCRFEPSCSHYAEQAISHHGFRAGGWLAIKRLSKCHPWHKGGFDPIPPSDH